MEKLKSLKTLVVTGANKGIGYSIIDGLLRQKNQEYKILLGSRSVDLGNKALAELSSKHGELANCIEVVQLDISCSKSIESFIDLIKLKHKSIDCLVNNAGVTWKGSDFNTSVFDFTFGVNVFDTISFTTKILENELISETGKIIIVGSSVGKLKYLTKQQLIDKFNDKDITKEKILDLAAEFRKSIDNGSYAEDGWSKNTYFVSKMCINKYAYALGKEKAIIDKGIQVYSCCPGWVKTDMGGSNAHRTLEEGSVTPVFLINLKYEIQKELQGQFFYDEKVQEI